MSLTCCAEGCDRVATETLYLRNQIGHVHDCPPHAHDVREWCDVTASTPIADGICQDAFCTDEAIWSGQPTPLDA